MAARQHISYECGACIGNHIHCGLNCKRECCLGRCTTRPACWECQVEKCQPAFFECAGVYPPRPVAKDDVWLEHSLVADEGNSVGDHLHTASGNACVDQTGWDVDFAARCYTCGFRTMGNAYRSGRCMAARQHISYECGACIGNHIHCGLNCKRECCLGRCTTRPACWECQVEKCQPAFFECAGVYPPRPEA